MSLRHRDRITVEKDGEEIDVWNFLNVDMPYQLRGGNPTVETYTDLADIEIGGSGPQPDYVTSWVADELWHELHLDNLEEKFGIEVIDIESDDVQVI